MVLYIPFTFGPNGNKKGTCENQVFWHMRNLRWGFVDHIDMKERVIEKNTANGSSYKLNVRSWFVHFTQWNAPDTVTDALDKNETIQIPYDDYNHYWNIKKYISPQHKRMPGTFKIVKKDATDTQEEKTATDAMETGSETEEMETRRNREWEEIARLAKLTRSTKACRED